MKVKTALITVSDKTGIADFAKELTKLGVQIISTGGTAKELVSAGVPVKLVEELTKVPEMLEGRVKTLHPYIHVGILANRSSEKHMKELEAAGIKPIDLVVVGLYPFLETVSKPHTGYEAAIEQIDIGGVALIRAAAKNSEGVAVVVEPKQYAEVLDDLKKNNGDISKALCRKLARSAFEHVAAYDTAIAHWFWQNFPSVGFPEKLTLTFDKIYDCRYGENPHQKAAFYRDPVIKEPCVANSLQLNGKEMSFNNVNDANAAIELVKEFEEHTVVIIKHTNPCGVASAANIYDALCAALDCDPISSFGGIISMNASCDLKTAEKLTSFFNEIIIAPKFEEKALELFRAKKNLRVLQVDGLGKKVMGKGFDAKKVTGGLLLQDRDLQSATESDLKVVTKKKPAKDEIESLLFAQKIAKHVKSNAIVLARGKATVGIGAGQMSRIDSVKLAVDEAKEKAKNAVMASDAFFPFRDGIDAAADAGITAIIQPGGSLNDKEVIAAADEKGLSMVFTGIRHFRH